jgi:hypothetical protein
MRRRVIREVHPDHDPVEATDRRHTTSIVATTDASSATSAECCNSRQAEAF